MKVEEGKVVKLEYTITTEQGALIESSAGRGEPIVFIFGTHSGLPEGVNEHLVGMDVGEEKEFSLPPEKAFGTIDSGPTKTLPKNALPKDVDVKVGASFQAEMRGTKQTVNFFVVENLANEVVVRLVHPLAGKTIKLKVKVLDVQDAPPPQESPAN